MDFPFFKSLEISALAEAILGEAWTEQRKKEVEDIFRERKFEMIEHQVIGDYDLVLWRSTDGLTKGMYSVSINSGQNDPGDYDTQDRKIPPSARTLRNASILDKVVGILHRWAQSHGRLLIASISARKLKVYRKILGNHFVTAAYDDRFPDNLFYIQIR